MSFKQGDIVYIDPDPTKGHEQARKRQIGRAHV